MGSTKNLVAFSTSRNVLAGAVHAILGAVGALTMAPPVWAQEADTGTAQLAEVVVTAQKRSERLQDVPVPVTAIDTSVLAENGVSRLQDYYASVPGLSLTNTGDGRQTISIRGLTTGGLTNPTTGTVIDDVPFGSSTAQGLGGSIYPDIDPGELAGIEVLRGPQGTLYGASSIGGLLKYVTQDPSTEKVSGRVQVLGSRVQNGGTGFGVRGSVNLPVSETLAIRASAFTRRDAGYIENVTSGKTRINETNVHGGRIAGMWKPSDNFSMKLSALIENTSGDGVSQTDTNAALRPVSGDLRQARVPGTGDYSLKIQFYTATIAAKFGDLDFLSLSGYGNTKHIDHDDRTASLGFVSNIVFNVNGSKLVNFYPTRKFTQEFRLSSHTGKMFDWLVGAFYTRERSYADQQLLGVNETTGALSGLVGEFYFPTKFSERAVFGNLTVNFTDRFNIQFGARQSRINNTYDETDAGPYVPLAFGSPSPFIYPTESTKETPFTYLVTPQYKFSPDLMVYARIASGYRSGGPNPAAIAFNLPLSYQPDKNNNYEIGIKTALFDRTLTVDASVYYIQWKDIQLQLLDAATQFQYFANAGNAKSQGVELAVSAAPARGLKLTAALSFNDAKLTEDLPSGSSAVALSGDRLPYSSRFSGTLSADQEFDLGSEVTGTVGASISHVGSRQAEFAASQAARLTLPSYTSVDLHVGARYDTWSANLFANNVGNKRGVLAYNSLAADLYGVTYVQPRTIGLSVTKSF